MLKRTLLTAMAAAATLAFAASARAAYLTLGTTNTSNATTTLIGSVAGSELTGRNTNGSSALAWGVRGQTASPSAAGVLGLNTGGGPGLQSIVSSNAVAPLKVNSTAKVANLNADQIDGLDSSGLWKLAGNGVSSPGVLGTTNNQPLALEVNGYPALRLQPTAESPNVIGGSYGNRVNPTIEVQGVVIGGGGSTSEPNVVWNNFGTIAGGSDNTAGDGGLPGDKAYATVGGGFINDAVAYGSTIAGGVQNSAYGDDGTVAGGLGNLSGGQAYSAIGGGSNNTSSGLASTVGGGESNTASNDLSTVVGGNGNTASGDTSTVAGGDENTASGAFSFAAGANASATHNGSFVWGDASGNHLSSNGANTVSFGATGGARFVTHYTNGVPDIGVILAANGGSWGSLSDRAAKRHLVRVDQRMLLRRLNRIPISRWSYKAQKPSIRHLGPMAQDFHAAFRLGEDNRHIDSIDSEGVALAAIQGLYRQNRALERQNTALRRTTGRQDARLSRLERQMAALLHKHR